MPAKRSKRPPHKALPPRREPAESRAAETLTIAWTVSVTGVVIADLMLLGAHLLVRGNPNAPHLQALTLVVLMLAAGMGAASLALLPFVWSKRRLKPPQGYIAFALIMAAAPIAALLGRLWGR